MANVTQSTPDWNLYQDISLLFSSEKCDENPSFGILRDAALNLQIDLGRIGILCNLYVSIIQTHYHVFKKMCFLYIELAQILLGLS